MTKKFEALWIAAQLESWAMPGSFPSQAVAELRRLHEANVELLEALTSVRMWMEDQADGQSKGGHATFDLMALREQRDIAEAAIDKATGETE